MSAHGVRVEIDARREADGARVRVSVRAVNRGGTPWRHTLPTSERARITARALDGSRVFESARGRFFLQVLTPVEISAGEELTLAQESFNAPQEAVVVSATVPGTDLAARVTV